MALGPDRCPEYLDDIAEAYLMRPLSPADAAAFEKHYIACSRCAAVLEATDPYVHAMASAARHVRLRFP